MPVGDYTKDQIREIAAKIGLPVAKKKDSQEICFVPDQDYASFIQNETGIVAPKGNFVNTKGEILGTHEGITHYTVGQRRGLGLPMGHRVFVLEIRPETNEVVVGENEEVFAKVVKANKVNYMAIPPLELGEELSCTAKIRYGHKGSPCVIKRTGEDEITCTFPDGVRAPTPGQAVVFYVDGCVGNRRDGKTGSRAGTSGNLPDGSLRYGLQYRRVPARYTGICGKNPGTAGKIPRQN